FVNERFGGHEREGEIGMDLELRRGLLRCGGAAFRITQAGELVLGTKLIDVIPLSRPRDAAQHYGADMREVEGLIIVSQDGYERTVIVLLVSPHLRLDVIHRGLVAGPAPRSV